MSRSKTGRSFWGAAGKTEKHTQTDQSISPENGVLSCRPIEIRCRADIPVRVPFDPAVLLLQTSVDIDPGSCPLYPKWHRHWQQWETRQDRPQGGSKRRLQLEAFILVTCLDVSPADCFCRLQCHVSTACALSLQVESAAEQDSKAKRKNRSGQVADRWLAVRAQCSGATALREVPGPRPCRQESEYSNWGLNRDTYVVNWQK